LLRNCTNAIELEIIRSPFRIGRSGNDVTTAFHKMFAKNDTTLFFPDYRDEPDTVSSMNELSQLHYRAWTSDNDLEISFNAIKLSSAKDAIRLEGGMITDFGISESDVLKLTMAHGSTIETTESDIVLKSNDEIRVTGLNNKIIVKKKMTIAGDLILDEGAELTFEFYQNGVIPEIHFANDAQKILAITQGSIIIFKGRGKVIFKDGYTITFGGATGTQKAELRLQDSVEFLVGEPDNTQATCSLTGSGKLLIDSKARLHVQANRHCTIGLDAADDFEIVVDDEGAVFVEAIREQPIIAANDLTRKAKLSLQLGTYSIDVKRQGKIHLGRGGLFEINAYDQQEQRGYLTTWIFDAEGIFAVDAGGLFLVGRNIVGGSQELPILCDNINGVVGTGGIIGFVGTDFIGMMQNNRGELSSGIADSLVEFFLNAMPSLLVTTAFIGTDGKQKIRTKNGVIVTLHPDDTILEDNIVSGNVSVLNRGELVIITPDGQRI